jgi:hypothetical protein
LMHTNLNKPKVLHPTNLRAGLTFWPNNLWKQQGWTKANTKPNWAFNFNIYFSTGYLLNAFKVLVKLQTYISLSVYFLKYSLPHCIIQHTNETTYKMSEFWSEILILWVSGMWCHAVW